PEFLLALPILHGGEVIGGFVAELAERKAYDERIEGILTDVVNDMGGALVRVYKAASAEGAAQVEGELMQFSSGLLQAETTEEIWEALFALLFTKTSATSAMAYRRTDKGFILESVAGCTPTENFAPLDEGLLGWTALAGRPVTSSREDRRKPPVDEGQSYLAFPIGAPKFESQSTRNTGTRSVVILCSEEKRAFTSDDMDRVREIASAIEPVIQTLDRMEEFRMKLDQDELTGLLNEAGFRRRLGVMAIGSDVSLISARVENFAELTDEFGRRETRAFTKRVANLLETTVSRRGILARIEGGQFVAAVKGEASPLLHEISSALDTPSISRLGESDVRFRVSSVSTQEGVRCEELVDAADSRLSPSYRRAVGAA
ncbi:MAG: diguanylate cyclase, partial [Candidatus Hydrogenedentota bacterium]